MLGMNRNHNQQQPQPQHHTKHVYNKDINHKKALLIGINYIGTKNELGGCISDVMHMRDFLVQHRGFSQDPHHMLIMTDQATDPHLKPYFKNMIAAFQWLITGNQPGDQIILHYSGHGGQVNHNGKLLDTLIPLDFQTAGQIDADLLHKLLVRALQPGVKMTVVLDCCHSGHMLELPYTYRPGEDGAMSQTDITTKAQVVFTEVTSLFRGGFSAAKINDAQNLLADISSLAHMFQHRPDVDAQGYKHEHFSDDAQDNAEKPVFVLSGCMDEQTSADTSIQGYGKTGALSYAVLTKLKQSGGVASLEDVLSHAREFMKTSGFTQVPQLSCGMEAQPSHPLDI